MANFPSLNEIAGKHIDVYEAYYRSLDPKNTNVIMAMDAAKFLKKSGLSDVVLSRVWDLSDYNSSGSLDKLGLYVGLKMISLAQMGENINLKNIRMETNAPRCGDVPKMKPPPPPKMVPVAATDWSVKPEERAKYVHLFNTLQPANGVLPGNKVVGLLKDSKLPTDTLSAIWELADQDKDGSLDEHEFVVAMHLVYKALDSRAIPSSLPKELQKPAPPPIDDGFGGGFVANFPTDIVPVVAPIMAAPSRPPVPSSQLIPAIPAASATGDWVLTTVEKLKYHELFEKCDLDKDGLVSGVEIKDVFLKSGLPTNMLAHIWALCDTDQSGKLSSEQFALACWLIDRKKKGIDPPQVLAPEMIPPTMRAPAGPPQPPKPIYTNPELEMISKEIEELTRERHVIEAEVAQKEADIRIKTGEMRSLQSELDTLTATLKQLETQRGEAQKRLDDLKNQVIKLREQCQKQEETIKEQETELDSRKLELQKLKDEEKALETEYDTNLKEKDKISTQLQDTQLQISQVRRMFSQVEEIQRQMRDALAACKAAVDENNASLISDYSLNIEPDFQEFKSVLLSPEEKAKAAFNGHQTDHEHSTSRPPKPVAFEDSFNNPTSTFGDDDSWHNNSWNAPPANDPFAASKPDPFGATSDNSAKDFDKNKDDFGSDPFAALHAPTSRSPAPESPQPALPPKKAKQPPPRPAPPRPSQGPKQDAFSSSSGFANFEDFDMKVSSVSEVPKVAKVAPMEQSKNHSNASEQANDFKEDPFQNYRYEDPFLISDPFQDEESAEPAKVEDAFAKSIDTSLDNAFNKFSFDDAADPFADEKFVKKTNGNDSNNNKDFDPFGVPSSFESKKSSSATNDFGFDGDFANFDAFNSSGAKNGNGATTTDDAWGSLDKTNNNTNVNNSKFNAFGKVKKYKEQNINKFSKFSPDYSDNFEKDLEQVLKRSVVDQ